MCPWVLNLINFTINHSGWWDVVVGWYWSPIPIDSWATIHFRWWFWNEVFHRNVSPHKQDIFLSSCIPSLWRTIDHFDEKRAPQMLHINVCTLIDFALHKNVCISYSLLLSINKQLGHWICCTLKRGCLALTSRGNNPRYSAVLAGLSISWNRRHSGSKWLNIQTQIHMEAKNIPDSVILTIVLTYLHY